MTDQEMKLTADEWLVKYSMLKRRLACLESKLKDFSDQVTGICAMLPGNHVGSSSMATDINYVSTDQDAITTKSGRIEPSDVSNAARRIREYQAALKELKVVKSNLKMTEHAHFLSG